MTAFSLVIPVLNEAATLQDVAHQLLRFDWIDQLLFVDDGSTDKTPEILKALQTAHPDRVKVIVHVINQGKGAAIRTAIREADGDYLAIQDADMEYNPEELKKVLAPLKEGRADVVFGSRFLEKNPNLYRMYLFGNKVMTTAVNLFGRGTLTDSYTCYKAMSLERWKALKLESSGFEIEAEISMKCLLRKWRIMEVPIQYNPRSFEAGKKIRGKDAFVGLKKIVRCWFSHR